MKNNMILIVLYAVACVCFFVYLITRKPVLLMTGDACMVGGIIVQCMERRRERNSEGTEG